MQRPLRERGARAEGGPDEQVARAEGEHEAQCAFCAAPPVHPRAEEHHRRRRWRHHPHHHHRPHRDRDDDAIATGENGFVWARNHFWPTKLTKATKNALIGCFVIFVTSWLTG